MSNIDWFADNPHATTHNQQTRDMTTSKGIRSLIQDAQAKGLRVEESSMRCLISTGKTSQSVGLVICEDGTAYRCDIAPDMCTVVRRQHEMRAILGL